MSATVEELDARIAQAERKKRQLENLRHDKLCRAGADERKARNHALMVAGGLLMQHMPDGDWKRCDFDKLAYLLKRNSAKIRQCHTGPTNTETADERLREWERRGQRNR